MKPEYRAAADALAGAVRAAISANVLFPPEVVSALEAYERILGTTSADSLATAVCSMILSGAIETDSTVAVAFRSYARIRRAEEYNPVGFFEEIVRRRKKARNP